MRKYVIMGVQGSGKGTQARLLCERYDLVHISVGDIFRWNVQAHTKLAAQVRRTVAAGRLVSDDLVEAVVRERLDRHDWNYGFVVDGFPRNVEQAEFFLESYDIDGVVHLDLPDDEVRRRVLARRLCSRCGLDYNLIASRPAVPDTCDVCGGTLVAREDDTPEALEVRIQEYHQRTQPVLDLFRRKVGVCFGCARFLQRRAAEREGKLGQSRRRRVRAARPSRQRMGDRARLAQPPGDRSDGAAIDRYRP